MRFKLTPNTKHYVNADGDRCEVAFLNDRFLSYFTDKEGYPIFALFDEDGTCTSYTRFPNFERGDPKYNITAEFTGWLSDPFADAPDWVKYATQDGDGDVTWWSDKPYMVEESQWWDEQLHVESLDCGMNKYQGDWRNSLTCREDWQ